MNADSDAEARATHEDLEAFTARARAWLSANMPQRKRRTTATVVAKSPKEERADLAEAKRLQGRLAAGGFAGLLYPREYGGQGLSHAHQSAFSNESAVYEIPPLFAVTLGIVGPTLLEHGTEEQKRRYLPPMIRGEELWVQLFSEPTGGSDLAGAITRADRDGDCWVLSGSKVWTTGAQLSDYGLCLARSNWDVPKHQGLSVFIVPLSAPGVTILPITQLNGNTDFCQEFFDQVVIPVENLLGEQDHGWSVVRDLLVHERNATGGVSMDGGLFGSSRREHESFDLASASTRATDAYTNQLMAESYVLDRVELSLRDRVMAGFRTGKIPGPGGSILKLFSAEVAIRRAKLNLELAGTSAVAWEGQPESLGRVGEAFLMARASSIGGGTNEIQRNIIGERILGMPREPGPDRDIPFREVRNNLGRINTSGEL